MNNIDQIKNLIKWLEDNNRSTDIVALSNCLAKFSTQCFYFSELVAEAYAVMNVLEDEYKRLRAEFIRDSEEGITKAKELVEVVLADKKAEWTAAINTHNRYRTFAKSFETISETYRQKVSVTKALDYRNNDRQV